MVVRHIPDAIHFDPDIWERASYFAIAIESALREQGGTHSGPRHDITLNKFGFDLYRLSEDGNFLDNISVQQEFITGKRYHEKGTQIVNILRAEDIIAQLIGFAPTLGVQFHYISPVA